MIMKSRFELCFFQRFADEKVHPKELFESSIKLIDQKNITYSYKASAILVLSQYSNTATIVKYDAASDNYLQLNDCIYSETKELSKTKLLDLFDTSSYTLVFYHQVRCTQSKNAVKKMFFFNLTPFDTEFHSGQEYVCFTFFKPFFPLEKLRKLRRCREQTI